MNLKIQEITFKSAPEYYHEEVKDIKNNTERIIDWEDERFHILELMRLSNEYGFIRIKLLIDDGLSTSFKRRIRHICKWDKIMIITWEEK